MRTVAGAALVFGDEVNTDELHPSMFYSLDDTRVRAGFLRCVEGREHTGDEDLAGRIVLAGHTFGIGSSRETGARVFLLAGIAAVVAVSFARIFQRNLMNLGIPALACPALAGLLPLPDGVPVRLEPGGPEGPGYLQIEDQRLPLEPLDSYWTGVLAAGGLTRFLELEPLPFEVEVELEVQVEAIPVGTPPVAPLATPPTTPPETLQMALRADFQTDVSADLELPPGRGAEDD